MPYGENYCQLQLLFVFDCYRPSASFKKTVFQWTLSLVSAVGLVGDAVQFTLHLGLRVSYPEPGSTPDTLWSPARLWNIGYCLVVMLPALSARVVLLYLPTSFSDHMSSPLSGWRKSPSVSYRQSLSMTASFLVDYLFGSCNTHEVL